ncbi:MAG TPA: MMPL family transporter, partial [Acidimicrobiales bacterium]|nr:MMPL family transporter [Acidimicrobiales bacterium]
MSNWLYRIGRRTARHRYLIVAGWVLIALTAIVVNKTVDAGTVDDFEVPGVESQEAIDLLDQRFPQRSGATALVVFNTTDGSVTDASNS